MQCNCELCPQTVDWSLLDMVTIKTPYVRFSFGPTPLYSGPAQQMYVLEGPSVSVGRQTEIYLQRLGKTLRWPASTRSHTHMPLVKHCQ